MRKLSSIFLAVIIYSSNLLGQVQTEIKNVLEKNDFIALKKLTDSLENYTKGSRWEYLRDITNEFQEGVFTFWDSVPKERYPKQFHINIIRKDNNIIFFECCEEKLKGMGHTYGFFCDILYMQKKSEEFDVLRSSFESIYKVDLNENDLFQRDFAYGNFCGFPDEQPMGRKKINKWIIVSNKNEILNWLRSANTEKQFYAIDGLLQLRDKGIQLTNEELKIMTFVTNKKGTIRCCSVGSVSKEDEIKLVAKNFKL